MNKLLCYLLMILLGVIFLMCKPAQSTLRVSKLPNYNAAVADHILFLDFSITQFEDKSPEKVELVNAISGSGKIKNLGTNVNNLHQIKLINYFSDGRNTVETVYEHPLFRSVEVFDSSGVMIQNRLKAAKAILSVRVQENKAMNKIELYSITPEKGSVKIYSLALKQ